jgi:hypothetical protein
LKKSATILFATLYLLASSGILVGEHICMGRVKETALFKKVEVQCGMSMEMHQDMDDCCNDEWSLKKVEDSQQSVSAKGVPVANYFLLAELTFSELPPVQLTSKPKVEIKNTGPPDTSQPELFLLYQNLKIPFGSQA